MKRCWCGNEELEDFCEGYFFCKKCGSLITKEDLSVATAGLDDNADFYGRSYWEELMMSRAHTENLSELIDLYIGERAAYWLGCLYKYLLPGHGSVAEVGCGMGQFTYLLKCSGYEETGFDLSPAICDYISKELSINVVNAPFTRSDKKYSAVVAMDLLEHLEDPVQFMQDVCLSLTEDGIALFQTPCFNDAVDYNTIVEKNPRFLSLMSPGEHLILFSRRSVEKLLREAGFKDIRFIDAYFGNNYDMFVAASKQRLHEHAAEEIRAELYRQPSGRILNALIQSASERDRLRKVVENLSAERALYTEHQQGSAGQYRGPESDGSGLNRRYSDGWIGRSYYERIAFGVHDDLLMISGTNLLFENGDIDMTVYIDGEYAGCQPCPYGRFRISVPVGRPGQSAEVGLAFNKTATPASRGTSEDHRDLSIILLSICGQNSRQDI